MHPAAIAGICLPFVVVYFICQSIKNCYKKVGKDMLFQKLKSMKYAPGKLKGESECSICMQSYLNNDLVVVLPCNGQHHFHSECLRVWLQVSSSCPLCRQQFG